MKRRLLALAIAIVLLVPLSLQAAKQFKSGEQIKGQFAYKDFEKAAKCRQCHVEIYHQWDESMMSDAYTHHWDEIEYFELAVEHAKRNPKFKEVADGCNGCHAPFAYMAGDVPPPRPEKGSMANESVSCDVCHTINGFDENVLNNFSYYPNPGRTKFGVRGGANSPVHDLEQFEQMGKSEFCANCHNERSPWGAWVKATYNEWAEGPYKAEGVQCQTCHMPKGPGRRANTDDTTYPDMAYHLFHGAHVHSKTSGAIDVLVQPNVRETALGDQVKISVQLYNQKCGHKVPSGSVEDRLLYLTVTATDSAGNTYHLAVDKKGFEGEEYTIASDAMAYQDLSEMTDVPDGWNGLPRDGVPVGDRIFRMPYFTEDGVMTMAQWNTASFGVDYRIGPRETKIETFTWQLPDKLAPGKVTFRAVLNYKLLVPSVGKFLNVPEEEYADRLINFDETEIHVF